VPLDHHASPKGLLFFSQTKAKQKIITAYVEIVKITLDDICKVQVF
jgi:hypothetical protein